MTQCAIVPGDGIPRAQELLAQVSRWPEFVKEMRTSARGSSEPGLAFCCRTLDRSMSSDGFIMRFRMLLLPALALASSGCGASGAAEPTDNRVAVPHTPPVETPGRWEPGPGLAQVRIWPGTAPDGTFRPQPPESVQAYDDPAAANGISQAVLNIAVPTMTIMPAKGRHTGTAVIVFPGGDFQKVFIDLEGTEICGWLTGQGITCIVSKYRAPGGNDFWDSSLQRQVTPAIPERCRTRSARYGWCGRGRASLASIRTASACWGCRLAAIWSRKPAIS